MEVNELILLIKKKIEQHILIENIIITDKTYLHEKHLSYEVGKFHLELRIKSEELKTYSKIQSSKKIYKILDDEIKKYIHSIQILIN
jgi:BolA protein